MYTLGINAAYHDSSACLVEDGRVLAAAEEERFTGIKHAKRPVPFSAWELPYHAIDYCLAHAGIELADLDHVGYAYDPYLRLDRSDETISLPLEPSARPANGRAPWEPLFLSYIVNAERQLLDGAPHRLAARFRGAKRGRHWRWHFVEHHLCHEASAFLASPFDEAAVMTIDGSGERTSTCYGHYAGGEYRRLGQVPLPHSLGLLYEDVTEHLGFQRSSDEFKVMALASYGTPAHADAFRDVVRLGCDGSYEVRPARLADRFGPPRAPGEPLEQRHFDIASSLQLVVEESVLALARWLQRQTGAEDLCLAGGVALNCVLNGKLRDAGIFRRVWVQPAAGDAGTALGAALWIDWSSNGRTRRWRMDDAYLGPEFAASEIAAVLDGGKLAYRRPDDLAGECARLLAAGNVVGWFQGRMEFGPRALGARSILASPIDAGMRERLNRIKGRESFRPVAPAVLEDEAGRWFSNGEPSPFMLFACNVAPGMADRIPAGLHVDGSARVQTVRRDRNPLYYDLLHAFQRETDVPVLVNTSLNIRGRPIACTPRDALDCFFGSPLDALALGPYLLEKARA